MLYIIADFECVLGAIQLTTGMSLLLAIFSVIREHPHPTVTIATTDSLEVIALDGLGSPLLTHCCNRCMHNLRLVYYQILIIPCILASISLHAHGLK